jgi:hypothetical protein
MRQDSSLVRAVQVGCGAIGRGWIENPLKTHQKLRHGQARRRERENGQKVEVLW